MSVRVLVEKIRGEIDAVFEGSCELSEIIADVVRLGARLIIQTVQCFTELVCTAPAGRR